MFPINVTVGERSRACSDSGEVPTQRPQGLRLPHLPVRRGQAGNPGEVPSGQVNRKQILTMQMETAESKDLPVTTETGLLRHPHFSVADWTGLPEGTWMERKTGYTNGSFAGWGSRQSTRNVPDLPVSGGVLRLAHGRKHGPRSSEGICSLGQGQTEGDGGASFPH